jgi:maltose alpha-D-glucosyltransferase / alpha-amylase
MQWSTEPNGGFTKSSKPALPVISDGPYSFQHVNVAAQRRDPNSLLNWMERIVRMRKEVPEIGWGDFSFLPSGTSHVLAMRYPWRKNSVLCVHNLSSEPQEVNLSVRDDAEADCTLVNLLSEDHSHPEKNGGHRILFEPYGYRRFRICGLDYLLKRSAT